MNIRQIGEDQISSLPMSNSNGAHPAEEMLMEYALFPGELTPECRSPLEIHLKTCVACSRFVLELQTEKEEAAEYVTSEQGTMATGEFFLTCQKVNVEIMRSRPTESMTGRSLFPIEGACKNESRIRASNTETSSNSQLQEIPMTNLPRQPHRNENNRSPNGARPELKKSLPHHWRKVRTIGVVGSKSTGKTCYFGATYGKREEFGTTLEYQNQETASVLQPIWEKFLEIGLVPPPTSTFSADELEFRLIHPTQGGVRRWSFRTIDYSGEFIELATKKDATAQNLKTDVRAWLSKCDAVLFFVGLGDSNLREKLNELNVFITELLKLSGKKNALTIPVGLVLTKWDIQGPISYDPETEDRRVLEFVNSDQKFKEIAQTIRNCGDWVKVFPVSAFGAHRLDAPAANPLSSAKMPPASSGAKPSNTLPSQSGAKMLPASSGAKPFNILPPLVWAAEQASALRSKRFIKKVKLTAACLAIAACLCAWNYSYDTTRYANARDLLLADGSTPEQVQSACAEYNEVISPFKSVLGRSKEISQGFKEFNDHTALNLAYERANSEPTLAHQQAFVQSAGEFFAAWPQSRHTLQIRDRHAEVYPKLLAQYYEEYLVFRKNNDDPDKAELRIEEAKKLLQLLKDDPHSIRVLALISADEAVIRQRSCDRYLTFRANNAGAENAELRLAEGRKLAELLKDDPLLGKVQPLIAEDEGILKTLYFDNFVGFRTANKGPEKADLRVQEGEKLIEKLVAFKDTSISDKVSRMVAEDQCVAKIQRESQAIISNLNAAQAESGKAQNAVQKLETLLVAVGKVGADSNYNAEAQTAIKLFRESIVQVELEADDYRFASAQTSAQTNPDNADLIEQAYLDYLKYGKRHVDAARAELAKLPDLRDRLSWTGIAEYSQQNKNVATAEVFRKLVEKASDYQRKFPKGRFVKEAEDLISATNARHDEYDWKQANIFIQRNEGAYDRQIDKLEAYIHRGTPCVHKDEARKIIGQIEITWDRHEYGKVRDAIETARSVPRGANIKAAYDIANGYLESGHPLKAKTRAVREFVNWFDSFKIPRNIKVKVLNAVVEKGGRVDDAIFGGPDCSIRITLNGTACRTKQIEDSYTPAYNEELGPYSFSWRRQKVEVRIIDQDPGPSTDEAYGEAEDEFVIGALNGAFEFKCDKGKKITVYLECKDALLPTMPNY